MSRDQKSPFLSLRSVPNTRDLGGIAARSGKTVRPGLLFRASSLHDLSSKDRATLVKAENVRAVIDLRTPQEQREKPDKEVPGVRFYSLPVFDERPGSL